jgi:hypothetical protein
MMISTSTFHHNDHEHIESKCTLWNNPRSLHRENGLKISTFNVFSRYRLSLWKTSVAIHIMFFNGALLAGLVLSFAHGFRNKAVLKSKLSSMQTKSNSPGSLSLKALQDAAKDLSTPLEVKIAGGLINALFSVKPLWKYASGKARASMVERGARIGVDWVESVRQLEGDMDKLTAIYDAVNNKKVDYPEYYLQPFHAYDEGNLSWQVQRCFTESRLIISALPSSLTVSCSIKRCTYTDLFSV